ncbi:hypothetical protein OIN60_12735 [Paenibacillus sp. P96]|uniref:Prenyltransferase n=1 Tax=Paenibacillus zeirhizosphaerae TaxID=2987519 RepID=A0ABT9FSD7_9BACL|nr:hypothetical protein [Paenibacillus sp. P96]MDP4097639.1 hypothetical protein [Paenibacillus sp. P96]
MELLTRNGFERAASFMKHRARRLERALFEYEFETGPFDDVLTELQAYQNEDGGFGHGLEADLRCPDSSALATTRGLEILQAGEPSELRAEMILNALGYLEDTYHPELKGWDIIPQQAESYPRAIWWRYGMFRDYWGNPNADIIAFFIDYRSVFKFTNLNELIDHALEYLLHQSDLSEMHELFCYLHLAERLDSEQGNRIAEQLELFLDRCVDIRTGERTGYGATPLQAVDSPMSPFYKKYEEVIPAELDQLVHNQAEDGSWEPNWTWNQYEKEWAEAKREWQGVLTLQALRTLRNFNRIES